LDATAALTAADRVQTGLDRVQTGLDRVQTGLDVIASEAARDAAIATGKIYATTAAGIAATTSGQYFNVVASGTNDYVDLYLNSAGSAVYKKTYPASNQVAQNTTDITSLKDSRTALESSALEIDNPRNKYNPSAKQVGKYVKTNGFIDVASGWACTDYIPVVAGQQYTISANATKREGVAFYATNLTTTPVGSYVAGGSLPLTVTAPVGANYMVVNVQSSSIAEPSQIQIEAGSSATAFEAWRLPAPKVPRDGLTAAVKAELDALAGGIATANATKEYETVVTSKNLFNTATVRAGYYLNSVTGAVNGATGWGMSAFIPVTAGQQYTISGTRGRSGLAFFTSASDGALIVGSYNGSTTLPLTVTAPVTATHMVINLYSAASPTYSQIQVEAGATATDYTSEYGSKKLLQKPKITPEIREMFDGAKLVLDNTSTTPSYIQTKLSGSTSDVLKVFIKPFLTRNLSTSEVFNFSEEKLNDVRFKDSGDDIAPYRVFTGTIGANHGYGKTKCTVTGHTKTSADIGSVWTDGTNQWVIVDVVTGFIYVAGRTTANNLTTGTLTHVSGATNTTSFSPSAFVSEQWYPVIKNRRLTCSVDNQQLATLNGTFYYSDNVTFNESYEIMNRSSIVEWLITQVGLSPTPAQYDGTSDLSVSMSYVFDVDGNCTIYQDFLALNNVTNFQDIMFLQAIKFTAGVSGAVRYYIPKSLTFTHESVTYDFSTLRDMTGFSVSTRINMTSARCEATGQLCDRMLMMDDSVVGAFGFLPIQSADQSVRRTNASNKAMQISEAAKLYMSCIDGLKTTLTAGDYFSAVAYRNFFKRTSARTSCYAVRHPSGTYLYMDWHSATTDRVPVPTDMIGKSFAVVEKSANVNILSGTALTNTLVVQVTSAASYGYLIIKSN
ncbi:hypothetical protein, partial [uncultured Agitococcus sp.]|uniref:hypothetical protein n=1 Tax=uncultured Agitococcus sp. TaxID=1506599 RepID=UPI00260A89E9